MIGRRTFLAGLLASVTLPRLPIPKRGISYIVFEDIPLERFGNLEAYRGFPTLLMHPDRFVGHAMHDAAKGEIVNVRIGR